MNTLDKLKPTDADLLEREILDKYGKETLRWFLFYRAEDLKQTRQRPLTPLRRPLGR